VVDDERQEGHRQEEEFDSERVMVGVVGGLKLDIDKVEGGVGGEDEKDLHRRVVHAHKVGHQVQVPRRVRQGKQHLRLATYP